MKAARRMKVEIWSDVICPFCYIGKRRLERALAQLPRRDSIEVIWRSFQLQPDAVTDPTKNAVQHLAERKGWSAEFARQAAAEVSNRAKDVGLTFDYDRTVVANTFDAHRLAHFAASRGQGDEMIERLFQAYFTDGQNIGDHDSLTELAVGIGLPADEVRTVLRAGQFADSVRRDIDAALQMGINGVPFFVLDNKYAVSGAQDSSVFLEALQRSLSEWTGAVPPPSPQATTGDVCGLDGRCD
jgi:predicted DsbA family dithiol-disulfide isomerase